MSEQLIDFILAVSTVYFQSCFFCLAIKTTTMSSHSCCAQLTCVFCFHDLVVDLLFVQRRFDNGFEHFASQFRSWGWIDQDQPWKIPPHHHLTTHSVYLMKPCSELQIPLGFFIFKVDNWTNKTMSKLVIVLSQTCTQVWLHQETRIVIQVESFEYSITLFEKSNFCPQIPFWQNPNIFTSFSPKIFLTIFLVKSKLSTAKKSKTTTFSRVFHPKRSTIFSGNQSRIFGQKMKISNSVSMLILQ